MSVPRGGLDILSDDDDDDGGGSSSSSGTTRDISDGLKKMVAAVATFIVTGFVISFFTGAPFIAGFWGGLDQFVAWAVFIGAIVYFAWYADGVNTGFVISFIAILAVVSEFLPSWLTEPFSFISEALFGTPNLGIDRVELAVLLVATLFAYWFVRIRLFSRSKRPGAVANQVRTRAEAVVRQYAKISRVSLGFLVAAFFLFASAGADVLGETFGFVADAPVVGAYVASTAAYVGAFFSDAPVISQFGPAEYLVLLVAFGLIAVGAKYTNALDN